jgi:hypothetical protein
MSGSFDRSQICRSTSGIRSDQSPISGAGSGTFRGLQISRPSSPSNLTSGPVDDSGDVRTPLKPLACPSRGLIDLLASRWVLLLMPLLRGAPDGTLTYCAALRAYRRRC